MHAQYSRACPNCTNPFTPKKKRQQYCGKACASAFRQRETSEQTLTRFLSKVDRSGVCWVWTAGHSRDGYGMFSRHGVNEIASRVAWELLCGPIPDGLLVLHNCPGGDNPACVNPDHLWLGTQQENIDDCERKGRRRWQLRP